VRLATGLRKIVDMYGDRILAATGGWVDWEEPLGCGHYGCVWELANMDPGLNDPAAGEAFEFTRRVLKISVDPTEGPVVAAIMKTGLDKKLDGLVRWEGVWRIPSWIGTRAGRDTAWVIIREEVRPFNTTGYLLGNHPWNLYLEKYNAAIRKAIDLKTPALKNEAKAKANEALKALFKFEETYYLAQAIDALGLEGITLADIHQGNLGFRINPTEEQPVMEAVRWHDYSNKPPLLIFDPGHSKAPPTEVPDLW
jgi:hypothetical protein